nr:ABC transporter ATP-binding protein [Clostridia bacterium]
MALISCRDLVLSYENHVVCSELSFDVNSGDYLCIVGENGSGKSTLIKALLALKQINGGSITFGDGLKRTEIGYLPQQSNAMKDFPASVREVVVSGCLNSRGLRPFYSRKETELAEENMRRLDILDLKKKSYRELSGGQQQRVLLARALCATSKLLLLDEPVSGLDPLVTAEMYKIIEKLNSDGITIIMVSHDIFSSVRYASHILHLNNKPMFFGTTEDYAKSEIGQRFLGGERNV